jgi:hypothetical protein
MQEHDVFGTVQLAVETALAAAEAALSPHSGLPPVPRLLDLAAALRQQTAALRG